MKKQLPVLDKYHVVKDSTLDKFYHYMLSQGAGDKWIEKYVNLYNLVERGLKDHKTTLENAKREHIEKFINALNDNSFLKMNGTKYSGVTKQDIKKFVRYYYKWSRGEGEYYPKEVAWINGKIRKDERPERKAVIQINQLQKLADSFHKPQHRVMCFILFDSGFRIQELLSVKKKDLSYEEYDSGKKCWWIKCNQSKTLVRKIDIPLFTEEINDFKKSMYYQALADDDPLFNIDYDAFRMGLIRNSTAVLGVKLTPHCLRHSSATYYARAYKGDVILLATRYGWSYSADELKVYVRESGSMQIRGAQKVEINKLEDIEQENKNLKSQVVDLQKQVDEILRRLKTQPFVIDSTEEEGREFSQAEMEDRYFNPEEFVKKKRGGL